MCSPRRGQPRTKASSARSPGGRHGIGGVVARPGRHVSFNRCRECEAGTGPRAIGDSQWSSLADSARVQAWVAWAVRRRLPARARAPAPPPETRPSTRTSHASRIHDPCRSLGDQRRATRGVEGVEGAQQRIAAWAPSGIGRGWRGGWCGRRGGVGGAAALPSKTRTTTARARALRTRSHPRTSPHLTSPHFGFCNTTCVQARLGVSTR